MNIMNGLMHSPFPPDRLSYPVPCRWRCRRCTNWTPWHLCCDRNLPSAASPWRTGRAPVCTPGTVSGGPAWKVSKKNWVNSTWLISFFFVANKTKCKGFLCNPHTKKNFIVFEFAFTMDFFLNIIQFNIRDFGQYLLAYLKQVCDFFLYMVLQVGQPVLLFSKCLRIQALQTEKKSTINIEHCKSRCISNLIRKK